MWTSGWPRRRRPGVPGPGSGFGPWSAGRVLGRVAADRDDLVDRLPGVAGRRVQLRAVQAGHHGQAVGAPVEQDRRHDRGALRVDERDAVGRRDRDARHVADGDARQRAVRDRRIEPGPRIAGPRVAQDDGRAGRGGGEPRRRSRRHRSTRMPAMVDAAALGSATSSTLAMRRRAAAAGSEIGDRRRGRASRRRSRR